MKIENKIFDSEIAMCNRLHKKSRGCNWGKCKDCGVIPLLYKLHTGLVVENKKDAEKLKKAYLK